MTQIIAELGTLHLSSYDNAMNAVKECYDAGADMIKLQMIKSETAYWATREQRDRYKKLEWTIKRWAQFFEEANILSDDKTFASVFDISYLHPDILENMPALKLGHKARVMRELVTHTFAISEAFNKKLFVSIENMEEWLEFYADMNVLKEIAPEYLHVIPKYPTKENDFYLPGCGDKILGFYSGYSLHTNEGRHLHAALAMNPKYIEVHVQGSKGAEGKDTEFALNIDQLKRLISARNEFVKKK